MAAIVTSPPQSCSSRKLNPPISNALVNGFMGASLPWSSPNKSTTLRTSGKVTASATTIATPVDQEVKEYALPTWALFEMGRAPVFWKTMNGLPPSSGEMLKLFYNPAAKKLTPNEEFGIAFNGDCLFFLRLAQTRMLNVLKFVGRFLKCNFFAGGFNQPIMCGGEPRAMLEKVRGKADAPLYSIQICIPKHAVNLIFSFTNGVEWDGPYRLQFQVPKGWRNKQIEFFNEGLQQELSQEGACDRAIFPDTEVVATRCAMIGNLSIEGGDRCNLDLVEGCMDPGSYLYNPLANVDDGTCPIDLDAEDQN
ncbi:unnamed protein product [Linum tenue]|uniref:PIFI-like Ig-like domain-containing protein n=1 Tax=Linum tenue TaxID=586396 RepID=A0AAV0NUK2_9ROSI|nr:unnamed protein product [Linum tenue]